MAPFSGSLTRIVAIMLMWQKFMFAKSLIETHSYLHAYHRTAETSWDIKCCVHYFYSYCVRWYKRTLGIPLVGRKLFVRRETDTTMHTRVLQLVEILSLLYYEPLITRCKKYNIDLQSKKMSTKPRISIKWNMLLWKILVSCCAIYIIYTFLV